MSFQNRRSHLAGRDVIFPFPDVEVCELVNVVVLFYLQHPAFGESVSSADGVKATTTSKEAEWLR